IQALKWETDAFPGFHLAGSQAQIDDTLSINNCDIVVGIFWKRFGTPVRDAESGTEHELGRAHSAWRASRGKRPHIMVYFKDKKCVFKDDAEKEQFSKVQAFKEKLSKDGLWWAYRSKAEFEDFIREHLTMYLLKNAGHLGGRTYSVIRSRQDLADCNERIVRQAQEILFTTGSRSHEPEYLAVIKERLKRKSGLVHYRVLFGPPYHQVLKDHLLQLLEVRKPDPKIYRSKTLYLGLFEDYVRQSEAFIVGNEREALILLPSLVGMGEFNSGLVFTGAEEVEGLRRFVKQLYEASQKLETVKAIQALKVRDEENAPEQGEGSVIT
ncbi:MAG: hypothetical protein WBP93_22830, partial [Pyrinomonadaceae bacterium]